METYARIHIESKKTITAEVMAKGDAWGVKVTTEEAGRTSSIAYADAFVRKDHSCNDLCGDWTASGWT